MKEYIKKFESLNAADDHVIDNPFTSYIVGQGNLVCNEENKKLKVEGGQVVIVNNVTPPEMIDLGLPSGTLWAKYNLGVDPTDLSTAAKWYGNYYAWGEIETKEEYSWNTYKFGTEYALTKYNSSDSKTVLDPEDDVIKVIYGSNYCIPSELEIQELINETDNEWANNYQGISGLSGVKFMKKTNHSVFIFVPMSGEFSGTNLVYTNYCGYINSSNCSLQYGYALNFSEKSSSPGVIVNHYSARYYGHSVRAIQHVS